MQNSAVWRRFSITSACDRRYNIQYTVHKRDKQGHLVDKARKVLMEAKRWTYRKEKRRKDITTFHFAFFFPVLRSSYEIQITFIRYRKSPTLFLFT